MIKQSRHDDITKERRIALTYFLIAGCIACVFITYKTELELFIKSWCAL